MIDCLSNPAWISPQTDFLLFLQNIRVGNLEAFDKFFLSITVIGEFWLPTLICAITYWCIDSRAGMYLLSLESFNVLLAHLFKMLACVYRPWVLDNRIHPSELAVSYAKGYSFPSGHTAMSSSVLGGIAYLLKHNKKIVMLLIGLICLVGFSRLWLGVHTPQDIVGGLIISIVLIFRVKPIIDWAERDKNRYLFLMCIIDLFAVLALIYIRYFNSYRIDYIDGELLVDPYKSIYVTIVVYGFILGLINGCYACRKFVPFDPKEVSIKRRIIRGVVGTVVTIALLKLVMVPIFMNIINLKIAIPLTFLSGITLTLVYPFIFKRLKG